MSGRIWSHALAGFLLCAVSIPCSADKIELKNGHTVEGIVTAETDRSVTLRVAGGNIDFNKSQVKTITRSGPAGNTALESAWRDKRFLEKGYVPSGMEEFSILLRTLESRRKEAVQARDAMGRAEETIRLLEQERAKARDGLMAVSARLESAKPEADPKAYNELVAENNRLRAVLSRHQADLETELEARPARMKAISDYLGCLQSTTQELARVKEEWNKKGPSHEPVLRFLENASTIVADCSADFRYTGIMPVEHGNTILVTATVNGRAMGSLVVDTGAEVLTISRAFAEKAGIPISDDKPMNVIMADGRQLKAATGRLASLKIGDVETRDVLAVILPEPPQEGIDGLLGMNVLKEFLVRVDPSTGRLQLEQFAPR